jgi:hypothetical protein
MVGSKFDSRIERIDGANDAPGRFTRLPQGSLAQVGAPLGRNRPG